MSEERSTQESPLGGLSLVGEIHHAPEGCLIVEPIDVAAFIEQQKETKLVLATGAQVGFRNVGRVTSIGPARILDNGNTYPQRYKLGMMIAFNPGHTSPLPGPEADAPASRFITPAGGVMAVIDPADAFTPVKPQIHTPQRVLPAHPSDAAALSNANGRANKPRLQL